MTAITVVVTPAVEHLYKLLKDPQPGLPTWLLAVDKAIADVQREAFIEGKKSGDK